MERIDFNNVKRHRVMLWSGDRAPGGSLNHYVLQLPFPIEHVIGMEWLSTSIPGTLLQIEDWGTATTSNGRRYWRWLDNVSNQRYIGDWQTNPAAHHPPSLLRILQISLWKPNGFPATLTDEHSIELEIYALHNREGTT